MLEEHEQLLLLYGEEEGVDEDEYGNPEPVDDAGLIDAFPG